MGGDDFNFLGWIHATVGIDFTAAIVSNRARKSRRTGHRERMFAGLCGSGMTCEPMANGFAPQLIDGHRLKTNGNLGNRPRRKTPREGTSKLAVFLREQRIFRRGGCVLFDFSIWWPALIVVMLRFASVTIKIV